MRVDDATQREARTRERQLVVGQEERELVAGAQERQLRLESREKAVETGQERGEQRGWRGSTEGQSTPDTEQRGEETI